VYPFVLGRQNFTEKWFIFAPKIEHSVGKQHKLDE